MHLQRFITSLHGKGVNAKSHHVLTANQSKSNTFNSKSIDHYNLTVASQSRSHSLYITYCNTLSHQQSHPPNCIPSPYCAFRYPLSLSSLSLSLSLPRLLYNTRVRAHGKLAAGASSRTRSTSSRAAASLPISAAAVVDKKGDARKKSLFLSPL